MNEYLFSYGTLQKAEVQLQLFGRLLNGSADSLAGYKTSEVEISDEAFLAKGEQSVQLTVIQSDGDKIDGMVFDVSLDELTHADKYEPVEYERVEVMLASGKQAWIYQKI